MANNQSTFTEELGYLVDEFDELQDLRWSDLQYLEEYRELKMRKNDGEPVDQSRLDQLELIFKNKIVTSARWNKFQNALVGMQTFIKDEVEGFVNQKQIEINSYVEQFDDFGIYNPSTQYYARNFVHYNDEVYISLKSNIGVTPSNNGISWRKLSVRGDTGYGVGVSPKGEFKISMEYHENDLALYNGNLYRCIEDSQYNYPTNEIYWELFLAGSGESLFNLKTDNKTSLVGAINEVFDIRIVTGDTEPISGSFWLDTSE